MSTYIITGKVRASSLETSLGTWSGSVGIPPFRVEADSKAEALRLAKEIIDPLETTEVHAAAVEELPSPELALMQLNAELNAMAGAILTPYEHYCEAERLVATAKTMHTVAASGNMFAEAQVHATLATATIPERGEQ